MPIAFGRLIRCVVVVAALSSSGFRSASACGWFKPCNGACGARTAAYYAPLRAAYVPHVAAYAPVATYYAPTTAYYAPLAPAAPQPIVSYMPETHYRSGVVNMPVTLYRPVAAVDPYTGVAVSVLRPTVGYRPVAAAVPYTTYRIMQAPVMAAAGYAPVTSYYAPATGCATTSCYAPTTSGYAPATACATTATCAAGACPTTTTSQCPTGVCPSSASACPSGVCPSSTSAYPPSVPYESAPSSYDAAPLSRSEAGPATRTYSDAAPYEGAAASGTTYAAPNGSTGSVYQQTPTPAERDREALESGTLKPIPQDNTPYVPKTDGLDPPARESSTGPNLGDPSDKTTSLPWDRNRFSRAVLRSQKLQGEVPVESSYDPPGGFRSTEPRRGHADATRGYDDASGRYQPRAPRQDESAPSQIAPVGDGWRASKG